MTRTIIAIASALLAAMSLFASAAEACISCEYVPSVVNSSSKSHSEERSTPRRENRTREVRESRENKKSRVTETAKSEKADKVQKTQKAEVEKVTPAASTAQVENSSVALVTTAHESVPAKSETPGDRGMEHSAFAEKRVALVIGNGAYKDAPLANPARDAKAIADLLKKAGFEVVQARTDVGNLDFKRALQEFEDIAEEADIAVVFYAGHAIEIGGENYMIPVDAKLEKAKVVEDETVSLERLFRAVAPAKYLRLVILDACRDNPFSGKMQFGRSQTRQIVSHGLAKVETTLSDTLIAYAASPGSTADDGDGDHSPYTTALLKNLAEPGIDIRVVFGGVRDDVRKITHEKQEPYTTGSLGRGNIFLVPAPAAPASLNSKADDEMKKEERLFQRLQAREAAQRREELEKANRQPEHEQVLKDAEAKHKEAEQAGAAKGKAAAEAVP